MSGLHGWETNERILDSGGFESRQRVLVPEPVAEQSEAGARWLGITYWQAVDGFTRGGVRASWSDEGGRLRLLGGATLLRFGPPELRYEDEIVSSCYAIAGGLLALRPGGSVTLAQRPTDGGEARAQRHRRGVPAATRCASGSAVVDRRSLREGPEPVPRCRQPPVLRALVRGSAT